LSPEAFIRANTTVSAPSLVPEIALHLAHDALPLWQMTEEELERTGLPPPYWAFAWAGGQALARHVLDTPAVVSGRRTLDLGAGGGLVAIAAARAGATEALANEVDDFALAAIRLNAALNGVAVVPVAGDLLGEPAEADVVLVGDLFYERDLASRALAFLKRAAAAGADVLIGDPKRTYLPASALQPVATYQVGVPLALEDMEVKRTTVWRLAAPASQR